MRTLGRALVAATWLLVVTAGAAEGQVFLASQSHPQFAIGPLFVVAGVRPDLGPVTVTISWSLTTPPGQRAVDINQDLFLLWPHEVVEGTAPGPADPALTRELEERGFAVSANGRLQLGTRDQMQMGTGVPVTPVPEVASFATYSRRAGAAAQLGSSTLMKIPWTPKLADPRAVAVLTFTSRRLITPKPATWFEEAFWGRRWVLAAGFGDIGPPTLPLFPMYFEHRDRVVRLGRELAVVVATFADAGHLRIEEVGPSSATRRPSRLQTGAEIVTMPLTPSEGIAGSSS